MVIQQVEDVALGLVDEHDLGGVDLRDSFEMSRSKRRNAFGFRGG